MSGFSDILPADVSCERRTLPDGSPAWYLCHEDLGELGRITVQGTADGHSRILTEITGNDDDPLAEKRREVFTPVALALNKELERLMGKVDEASPSHQASPPGASHMVPSKLTQCGRCNGYYAHLVFAENPATRGELENIARLMFDKIKQLNLPTWIIGAPMEAGVPESAKSMVLKVWPERQEMQFLTPDEFNAILGSLESEHC
ncbi:hypothetical protein ACQU0X_32235 [Pseudovibrio ascidiaceicola]|uniref:hypothetical protein n=1 Tax=Pseudovibrio ascidiaceicola TaxID=285279 RepID=UPI003D36D5A0